MQQRFKNITTALLIASYLFVGIAAQSEALGHFFGLGHGPYSLAPGKKASSSSTKVYWTQYKHIPTFVKIVVPSQDATAVDNYSGELQYFIVSLVCSPTAIPSPYLLHHSTRAPPFIS
jgi:hypothetical protein